MKDNYRAVLEKARFEFAEKDPAAMAAKGAVAYLYYPPLSTRLFIVPFLGRFYRVTWPGGEVFPYGKREEASFASSLIVIHYLSRAPGDLPEGKWLSFKELWGGKSYNAAFEQRALQPIAKSFHGRLEEFSRELEKIGGERNPSFKNSYLLFALPRIPLLCILNPGDEEVPTRANILFDAAANKYLETEDLAVLGEILAYRLTGEITPLYSYSSPQ